MRTPDVWDVVVVGGDAMPEEIQTLPSDVPSVFVDFSGNGSVVREVHRQLGARLKYSASLGVTHWEHARENRDVPRPAPNAFSASHWASKRVRDWGATGLQARTADALGQFLEASRRWLRIVRENGRAAVEARYRATLEGRLDPSEGCVLSLSTE